MITKILTNHVSSCCYIELFSIDSPTIATKMIFRRFIAKEEDKFRTM